MAENTQLLTQTIQNNTAYADKTIRINATIIKATKQYSSIEIQYNTI